MATVGSRSSWLFFSETTDLQTVKRVVCFAAYADAAETGDEIAFDQPDEDLETFDGWWDE